MFKYLGVALGGGLALLCCTFAAFASVKDYQVCLQAYVNVAGYLEFAHPTTLASQRVAFDIDFEHFVQLGIEEYGEDSLRAMIPEPEESFIKSIVPLHAADGAEKTSELLFGMVAPCGGPSGELRAYYPG
ncbi:hypothetical protein [Tabrizicola sp.]|uniref:hypothetical protein n=1 Tax=Tabrizicola sp. TaxID=2005166 RepID=UPI003F2D8329